MKYLLLVSFLVLWVSNQSQSTFVYFQNNTSLQLNVNTIQYGDGVLSNSYWENNSGIIQPWQPSVQVMRTNRTTGITNGNDYFFDVIISGLNDTVILEIQLTGNFIDSDMWHSARGNGFNHPWYNDSQFYEENILFEGKNMTLKYQSALNGLYDDITFTLHDNEPYLHNASDDNNPQVLNVLSYNIFMLTPPLSFSDQNTRAEYLKNSLSEYDVIFIQEAFDNNAREDYLIPQLSTMFPYYTEVLDIPNTTNEDGGTMFFSKWPIVYDTGHVYQSCYSFECLTNKGVSYAKINKLGQEYHLFNTHTQAFRSADEIASRMAQIKEIRTFIEDLNIPQIDPVIVGGDMNVDYYANHSNEYDSMFLFLNAMIPNYQGNPYSFQPDLNYYASSGPDELLDYLLPISDYKQPNSFFNEVRIFRQIVDPMWGKFDMSDHFPVYGRFEYTTVSAGNNDFSNVNVYPNPTNDLVYIDNALNTRIQILSLEGKIIYSTQNFNGNSISIGDLSKGVYLIKISNGNNINVVKQLVVR